MERLLSELVEKLQKAHGDTLTSVVLYGSAALPEGKDRFSDFNVLCVLRQVGVPELAACEPVFRWWREMKNPAPVLLSELEVRTSTDCFPIEFHDIGERHRVLFGEDVVAGIEVDDSFYRAQVEHELRAKMLRLRQKAGGMLSERDLLLRLMAESLSTFCVLFRHALRLAGEQPQFAKRAVVAAARSRFGCNSEPFDTLLDLREEKIKPKAVQDVPGLFRSYLESINVVVDAVDKLAK
jgi:hypothetical protein